MTAGVRLLFLGETWKGSSARSLREALEARRDVFMDDIGEDLYRPAGRNLPVRIANRILLPVYRRELRTEIFRRIEGFTPDAVIIYKGNLISPKTVSQIREIGVPVVNVFPDCSPHAHGAQVRNSLGLYDLVISAKPFHPENWQCTYGYSNKCVCVPHGYDPAVHLWRAEPVLQDFDVLLAASWRPQYERVLSELAQQPGIAPLRFALAGTGWPARRAAFPDHWEFSGALTGRAYGEFVRRGKIVIAPVHAELTVNGNPQPGDQDTTRTYELAAAYCFFMHRRTDFVRTIYDEANEVPMWDDAAELATLIHHFLPQEGRRKAMARAAHLRAVPNYSIPARAETVLQHILSVLKRPKAAFTGQVGALSGGLPESY
jgi:spore maturation protein CgeB